ncbi:hypothetical protein NLJ89_g1629 [Agrocybe chaxingu]|uniref:F-box domain-containing protein n=1 Tax=Agrocybe chaxingu TaxID=84603 RepID=A0A9W8TEV4_9AGAR|nr:hypothetical protein NLJ89_g1629 [Agrocybe chaxingu]
MLSSTSTGTHARARIHILPSELLELIFNNNIDPTTKENSGLNATLVASWVCRSWRALLLDSPSLWASVIDLGCLTSTGISEIMARTGDAPLSVYRYESMDYAQACERLLPILVRHFHRIRYLRIFINLRPLIFEMGRPVYPTIKSGDWQPLCRPAPSLEHFDFRFHSWRRGQKPIFGPGLFGGQAARLRVLRVSSRALYPQDLNAPWVPQLRHLEFEEEQVLDSITPAEWLSALKNMPQLEFFFLKSGFIKFDHFTTDEEPTLPSGLTAVHLPFLTDLLLNIRGLTNATIFLKYILPAPNCRMHLNVDATAPPGEDASGLQTLFTDALSSHLQRWFGETITPSASPSINLHVEAGSITVELQPRPPNVNDNASANLPWHFTLSGSRYPRPPSNWSLPLKAFSPFDLGAITELELGTDSAVRCDTTVMSFLRSLCNVHTLRAGARTLDDLVSVGSLNPPGSSEFEGILFPELECVKVKYLIQGPAMPSSRPEHEPSRGEPETELWRPVRSFLDWRERMGSAVRVLDLRDWPSNGEQVPEFDDSNGMEVLYIRS